MEFPDDILRFIFFFLSTKDKLNILNTNTNFIRNISTISLLIPKMEYYMGRILSTHIKSRSEMMFIAQNFYLPYNTFHTTRINSLYSRNILQNTCIVDRCREKQISHIFIYLSSSDCYIKRIIPYCRLCFIRWGSFLLMPTHFY